MDFKWMKENSRRKSSKEWKKLAQEYSKLKFHIEDLEYQLEKVRARMIDLAEGKNIYGGGILVFHRKHKGHVDLKKLQEILEFFNIDLDDYRVKRKKTPYFYIMN